MREFATVLASLLVLSLVISIIGCSGEISSTPTAAPTPGRFSLSDASEVLNLSSFLSMSFEHVDAHSVELSNEDMGLGPRFSEVEVFVRDKPFQLIYTFVYITENRLEKAATDTIFEDDAQVRSIIESGIQDAARQQGVEDFGVEDFQISHPQLGNLATSGRGTLESYGIFIGFDVFLFRRNDTYVYLYSLYLSKEDIVFLEPIARELDGRLLEY